LAGVAVAGSTVGGAAAVGGAVGDATAGAVGDATAAAGALGATVGAGGLGAAVGRALAGGGLTAATVGGASWPGRPAQPVNASKQIVTSTVWKPASLRMGARPPVKSEI